MVAARIPRRMKQKQINTTTERLRCLRFLLSNLVAAAAAPPAFASTPSTTQITLDGHTFTLPQGFTIERAAGSPLVDRPIVADLDERGRLYVADSSGSVEKTDIQLQKKPHRILRLKLD